MATIAPTEHSIVNAANTSAMSNARLRAQVQPTASSSSNLMCCRPSSTQQTASSSTERIHQLADICRGASLSDVRVEVNIAHTESRLKARFFVEMKRVDASGTVDSKWGFGIFMSEIKTFESQLLRLIKKHNRQCCTSSTRKLLSKKKAKSSHSECAMCDDLGREMKSWDKLSSFQAIGKRHMDVKRERVTAFFYKLLRLVSSRASWLHNCELLREILRCTETLCRVEYPNDRDAICVIESLKRLPSMRQLPIAPTDKAKESRVHTLTTEDCSICLSNLHRHNKEDTTVEESSPARSAVELHCGHRFHDTCICLWFHTRLNCPICRTHAIDASEQIPRQ